MTAHTITRPTPTTPTERAAARCTAAWTVADTSRILAARASLFLLAHLTRAENPNAATVVLAQSDIDSHMTVEDVLYADGTSIRDDGKPLDFHGIGYAADLYDDGAAGWAEAPYLTVEEGPGFRVHVDVDATIAAEADQAETEAAFATTTPLGAALACTFQP